MGWLIRSMFQLDQTRSSCLSCEMKTGGALVQVDTAFPFFGRLVIAADSDRGSFARCVAAGGVLPFFMAGQSLSVGTVVIWHTRASEGGSRGSIEDAREERAAALKAQNEQLQLHEEQLAEHKAKIEAAVARFGDLDDYYILDEVTVLFANGKVKVDPKYEAPLLELAKKANDVQGYVIKVK